METNARRRRAAAALTLFVALATPQAGCRHEAQKGSDADAGQMANAQQTAAASPADITQLNAEIERLEKQAERNPADEETQDELARAYVKRARVEHDSGKLPEALADYQSALRHDPDNDDAQAGAAAATAAIGGAQVDENGAPAPLPITPNVADEEGKPTPTPKSRDK